MKLISYRLLGEILGIAFWIVQCAGMYLVGKHVVRLLGFDF